MGTFSAKFTNNSDTSKDLSFKLARENTIEDKDMNQSSDSTAITGLQEQMISLQQLVKQQAEQLNLLQQQANAANTSLQPQSESQSVAQSAATHLECHSQPAIPTPNPSHPTEGWEMGLNLLPTVENESKQKFPLSSHNSHPIPKHRPPT